MYRPPDEVLFEWQELLCCLKFMEEKEVREWVGGWVGGWVANPSAYNRLLTLS